MATLSSSDAKLFHKLLNSLLFYANNKLNIIKNCTSKEEFLKIDIEKTVPLRQKIFSENSIIDSFIKENPEQLNKEELNIISSWKSSKEAECFLFKHLNDSTLFYNLRDGKVYGVVGITDSFEEKFNGSVSIMLKIRLLSFKGRITYEGIFSAYKISFGRNMLSSFNSDAQVAIHKYGIIASFDSPVIEKTNSDEETLRFYCKTQDNRDRYFEEIKNLKKKTPLLEAIYFQEEGKVASRELKKNLKELGVEGHFVVLNRCVVASAKSKRELDTQILTMVPESKRDWIYIFTI